MEELAQLDGMSRALARERGTELIGRFRAVNLTPAGDLAGYPHEAARGNGSGRRPAPEVEERLTRLKTVRNGVAERLGVDRGTLLSNAVLQVIAEAVPSGTKELAALEGVRRWQTDLLGADLLASL